MSEQDIEQLEAIIPDEDLDLDTNLDDDEDIDTLKERLAEKEAEVEKERSAKRQMFARLKKLETKPHIKNKADFSEDISRDISELKLAEKKRQFGYKHGLSPEETDKLFKFSGNEDPEDTLKDTFFQTALKESRRQKDIDGATPSISNKSRKVEGKTFDEMTAEERKKNWTKITKVK
jgi:hypothetical protein